MTSTRRLGGAAFSVMLLIGIVMPSVSLQAEPDTAEVADQAVAHVLIRPVQLELLGPDPFDSPSLFGFRDLGPLGGFAGILAGAALDGVIDYAGSDHRIDKLARPLGDGFDFRQATLDGIATLDRGTDFHIAEVHEYKYSSGCRSTVSSLMRNAGADYVICLNPTWFIAPQLNQLRLHAEVGFYTGFDKTHKVAGPYTRSYEYLSPSRGELFRPFRAGEKEALIQAINKYTEQKIQAYPHNRKAYKKDGKAALNALEHREFILPEMAVSEGWPDDTIQLEMQVALDQIMKLVHADLIEPNGTLPEDTEYVKFAALNLKGRPTTVKGHVIGTLQNNTIYRDPDGNVYSMPIE